MLGEDTHPTIQEEVDRGRGALGHGALSVDGPQGDEWSDGIADVIAAMSEGSKGSCKNLKEGEELLDL